MSAAPDRSSAGARNAPPIRKALGSARQLRAIPWIFFLCGAPDAAATLSSNREVDRARDTISQNRTSFANKLFASVRPVFFPETAGRNPGNWLNRLRNRDDCVISRNRNLSRFLAKN